MSPDQPQTANSEGVSRRDFLTAASVAGAGLAAAGSTQAQTTAEGARAPLPTDAALAREQGALQPYTPEEAQRYFVAHPGSDWMVDLLKLLEIDYVTTNPGSSFRGLHESIVNHGGNTRPELLTCVHEEQAVAMAHGYAKAAGKPMAVAVHGTVGIQHAAMAVYNAWCDRAPVVIIAGNHLDGAERRVLEWVHSAQDCIRPIRDYIKWDDIPQSLPHFGESLARAYKIALTPPMGPVAVVADGDLQEADIGTAEIMPPRPTRSERPRADDAALAEAARLLASAGQPVILADRVAHDQEGVSLLVELAEALQAPVVNRRGRMNFPSTHYLSQGGNVLAQADVILALKRTAPGAWSIPSMTVRIARRNGSRVPTSRSSRLGRGSSFIARTIRVSAATTARIWRLPAMRKRACPP